MWMFKGQQVSIPAAGTNKKLHLFGALNFATNHVDYQVSTSKAQWPMETFLLKLFTESYPADYLVLVIDSVSYHQTPLIESLLDKYSQHVFVLWLPKYCPKLSLIERFWEHMKQVVFDNYYFGDESNLQEAVHLFFKEHNTNPTSDMAISFRLSKNLSEVENTPK
jgi:transposase